MLKKQSLNEDLLKTSSLFVPVFCELFLQVQNEVETACSQFRYPEEDPYT